MNLENLIKNDKVFYYFSELSKIPRGSRKEKQVSDWLVKFAKDRKLEVKQDEKNNVLIVKPATEGYEEYAPLILQGHMDMVWEKNKETVFDFETQGIELLLQDGFLKANGTTLGADNGIAVAYILALLDRNDLKHPEIEAIITADEEDGMTGVYGLDYSWFNGKALINLDTEEYGEVYVSSAGGARTRTYFNYEGEKLDSKYTPISIEVKGLSGGHSGAEIHLGLGNSNKILGEVLRHLSLKYNFVLNHIDGGDKVNAIPRECIVNIGLNLDGDKFEDVEKLVKLAFENVIKDFKVIDKNPLIEVKKISENDFAGSKLVINELGTKQFLGFLNEAPNGVLAMSKNIEGLVETSINIGVIKTVFEGNEIKIKIKTLPRSSSNAALDKLLEDVVILSKKYGAEGIVDSHYPSWEYKENSPIRDIVTKSFEEITGEKAKIKAIHAGLECGIFADNLKNLDVVSIGPNIYGAHTPEERMEIESVGKTWELLLKVLENYNVK